MAQMTIEVEAVLTNIQIDPISNRLILAGFLREAGVPDARPLRHFQEDVTDSLTAGQQATLEALVTKAEAWLANKVG